MTSSDKPSKPRSPHKIPAHTRKQSTRYDSEKEKAKNISFVQVGNSIE